MRGVQRYVSRRLPQLTSESGPNWPVAFDWHQRPVKVRPPVQSWMPALALSMTISPADGGGAEIVNVRAAEIPPPGAGVNTLTGTDRAVVRSDAEMSKLS